ncbi:MAG TPA: polysaccharide deacetylase family protein [Rhizomicrobium sp.]|nr:polysaccharide deacetylase family protein [Rhizomicrobium sp.]
MRAIAKKIAYRANALNAYHSLLHRNCLTVLMFHRVLPDSEMMRMGADPAYTITPALLAGVLEFVNRHYSLVSANEVLASLRRESPLPPRPLLVTFDDGWRDNVEWGLPVLRGHPWTMFVAAEVDAEPGLWWQEVLLWTVRTGRATYEDLWERAPSRNSQTAATDPTDILALLLRFGNLPPDDRRATLAPYEAELRPRCNGRQMVGKEELIALRKERVDLGAHGASHLPLSRLPDPADDLERSWDWRQTVGGLPILSLPHGRYDANVIRTARNLGYAAIFTSDPALNACPDGWLKNAVIGRISMPAASVCGESGVLSAERLSAHLYLRPREHHKSEFL